MPIEVKTPEDFSGAIGEKQPATVQFSAPRCGGCKMVTPQVLRQVPESNHDAESRITFGDDLLDAAGVKPIMNQRTPSCEAYPSGSCEL
ncbi:putative thioredoxin [Phytophthora cinnamomi]|uniref:putative thioredoxin n=1 Tax=Phytophthora cinnamomi TaxID=4785 RepID=UPI00355AC192|nr:putative thioredoxin [Phytophthora cinnamomi]